jgi:cytochrome d ubiquinol oxidase subunit I
MLGLGLWSLWRRFRGRLYEDGLLHRAALLMGPSGFVAVLAGWVTTEVGRQPFTVYGLLRTADSLAPVAAPAVGASLLAFIVVYFFVFGAGTFYILRLMNRLPGSADGGDEGPTRAAGITPASQLRPDAFVPGE